MRLEQYLTESVDEKLDALITKNKMMPWSDMEKLLLSNCHKYIKDMRGQGPLWRGSNSINKKTDIKELSPRQNRTPVDTPLDWTKAADDYFEKRFGWRPRQQGIFTTKNYADTTDYGSPWMVFPVGEYKYIYANDVEDFWTMYDNEKHYHNAQHIEELLDKRTYTDKNIAKASGFVEIAIGVKKYYMVHAVYWEEVYMMMGAHYPPNIRKMTEYIYKALNK